MMQYLPGLAPPRTRVVKATYSRIPNPVPDPAVQRSFADMGTKAVSQSADGGGYIHHHVIVNGRLFSCYQTPSAASLAVERVLGLLTGHVAFVRTLTSRYDDCRHAERTRTHDDRVRSGDGVGDTRDE